jgi:PAS domain S-box-containing protein
MSTKRLYVPPCLTVYEPKDLPEWMRLPGRDFFESAKVAPTYTAVVDPDRKYVDVSERFCELVGYKREELIGMPYDRLTAVDSADIPTTYRLFSRLGYMHGLWMLVHRTGYRILVRYEAWLRPDKNVQSNLELVQNIL